MEHIRHKKTFKSYFSTLSSIPLAGALGIFLGGEIGTLSSMIALSGTSGT